MIITTSVPHGWKRGDILLTDRGDTFVVRKVDAYTIRVTQPRWYERLAWWVRAKWQEWRTRRAWKRLERRIRWDK